MRRGANTFDNGSINKASVMEFYLKEKLRESGLREFEMFLKSN